MSVHYKFKSNLEHDTVTFDGLNISVADLKKSIMQQKKIGKSSDFDLQITNAQTKEVYSKDDMLVPKNTSVIVARVPASNRKLKLLRENKNKPDLPLPIDDDDLGQIRYDRIVKNADIANANISEEDKVKSMITQSSQEYDPSKFVKSRSMTGPLPPNYTCFRCGSTGHWIKNCPTNNPDVKRSTGIPRSFMVTVDGPTHKGALLTSTGDYAVPLIDHQAYKQVKKEKPPFVPQDEPIAEPEAEIPEELLCMVCKDLLQDAVLIPCCGNSFCDECVRQVLLESDNHECPECHEVDVSPNTLIPNRFLRTAVLNFKNETGYTRIKKVYQPAKPSPQHAERAESPQPSPDSTVENHPHQHEGHPPHHLESNMSRNDKPLVEVKAKEEPKKEMPKIEIKVDPPVTVIKTEETVKAKNLTPSPKRTLDEDSQEINQPGTPLADEPPVDPENPHLLFPPSGHDRYHSEKYDHHSGHRSYHRGYRDDYQDDGQAQPKTISTIETITNIRNKSFFGRPAPVRQQFPNQRPLRTEERTDERYNRDREGYHNRDYRRNDRDTMRGSHRASHHSRYERSPPARYHGDNYHPNKEQTDVGYESSSRDEESSRRHTDRYRAPPPTAPVVHMPPIVPVYAAAPPPVVMPPIAPPPATVFTTQPPPPGASPVELIAAQPPPPGVGPLVPPIVSTETPPFAKEAEKDVDSRTIEDKMEAFQRDLQKRDRAFSRDRSSRSRSRTRSRSSDAKRSRSSRSRTSTRSRTSSRSRSYSASKSWSRSVSRSVSRLSRSRSRTPLSSRSRSRSYTPSRSRSWSKARSYTRSRSRVRTESRSRSRSHTEPRYRKRAFSRDRERERDRDRSPRRRSRSRSFTPRNYRLSNHHRNAPYTGRHFTPPPYPGPAYQSQYGPPPAIPIPVIRPDYPPHHMHTIHPVTHPYHSRPMDHYPVERQPKCPPYTEIYPPYDIHQHQRYEREQRISRYDKRQDYNKDYQRQHPEVIGHRIPGYIGDRTRDYRPPGYRRGGPRKELIRELPHIDEQQMRTYSKEHSEDSMLKKKEEKSSVKHKKHHHHHKSRETKKLESKVSAEKQADSSKTSIKMETQTEKLVTSKSKSESSKASKNAEKMKEKKHKHKKHKVGEPGIKKKKTSKKEKGSASQTTDSDVKIKKKKKKIKAALQSIFTEAVIKVEKEEVASEEKNRELQAQEIAQSEVKGEETCVDTLQIFADEKDTLLVSDPTTDILKEEAEPNVLVRNEEAASENEEAAVEKMEEEIEEEVEDEEVEEEEVEEELAEEEGLHVDMPALSKWEREDLEEESELRSQRKSNLVVPKEEKGALSSDIIHRAELAILSKPIKPQITLKEKGESKGSGYASSPEVPPKPKEPELKSVVNTERLSPAIQVTISRSKDKRLTITKKDSRGSRDQSESRHIRLERSSNRSKTSESSHRVVSSSSSRIVSRPREDRDRTKERHERPIREITIKPRTSSHESRDRRETRRLERESRYDDERLREERKRRFANENKTTHDSREHSDSRESMRSDRRRNIQEHSRHTRNHNEDRTNRVKREGGSHRSRSQESSESQNLQRKETGHARKTHAAEKTQRSKDHHKESSTKMKHSPIKPPEKHNSELKKAKRDSVQDEFKFEPDYEDYSEEEEEKETKERQKRKSMSPDTSKKRARLEKIAESSGKDRSSATSSASSSEVSDSDSSDTDVAKSSKNKTSDSDLKRHKKSKHKKHKKHKHRHKKKKNHKSKRE